MKKSKQEQEEGWDLAAYGAAYEADRPTSSFPQCSLTVCTVYLQVEIYSHIEMHSHCTRTHHHVYKWKSTLTLIIV